MHEVAQAIEQARVLRPEDPTSQHHVEVGARQSQAPNDGIRHGGQFVAQHVDDRPGDRVAIHGSREDGRRKLSQPRLVDSAGIQRLRHRERA
jgi:hypothetical protein